MHSRGISQPSEENKNTEIWAKGSSERGKKKVKSSLCLCRNAQLSFYEETVSPHKHLPDKRWCLRGSSSVMKTHHL